MTDKIFQLPDKRGLGYTLYGPSNGKPVIYFHGTPSSRLEPSFVSAFGIDLNALLSKYNLCLIAVDRPGMGLSTFNSSGDFNSFANDLICLLQFLKVVKCSVMAWSGGGPFALAMAARYPAFVEAVYIVTAFSIRFDRNVFRVMRSNKLYFGAAKKIPAVLRFVLNIFIRKGAKRPILQQVSGSPKLGYTFLTDLRKMKRLSSSTIQESCRQGSKGAVYEAQLYFKDLGYRLQNIHQPVHFWWGANDRTVLRLHAEAVEKQVPNAIMHYKKNVGHLSIYTKYLEEVFETISTQ